MAQQDTKPGDWTGPTRDPHDEPSEFGLGYMPDGMAPPLEGYIAYAGEKLPDGTQPAEHAALVAAMQTVYDPEIPVNIYDLGLIYRCDQDAAGDVKVEMSLTAPGCPVAGILPQQVADALAAVEGVGEVEVHLVWDPPWTPDRMSDDAKLALDIA